MTRNRKIADGDVELIDDHARHVVATICAQCLLREQGHQCVLQCEIFVKAGLLGALPSGSAASFTEWNNLLSKEVDPLHSFPAATLVSVRFEVEALARVLSPTSVDVMTGFLILGKRLNSRMCLAIARLVTRSETCLPPCASLDFALLTRS